MDIDAHRTTSARGNPTHAFFPTQTSKIAWTTEVMNENNVGKACYVRANTDCDDFGQFGLGEARNVFDFNGRQVVAKPDTLLSFKRMSIGGVGDASCWALE